MFRNDYHNLLKDLSGNSIYNPTIQNLMDYCPHLTQYEVEDLIAPVLANEVNEVSIAIPAILLAINVNQIRFSREDTELKLSFYWTAALERRDQEELNSQDITKAIEYANLHWGDELLTMSIPYSGFLNMLDPLDVNQIGIPKITTYCWAADGEKLLFLTTDPVQQSEIFMAGKRNIEPTSFCSHCGSIVSVRSCPKCGGHYNYHCNTHYGEVPQLFVDDDISNLPNLFRYIPLCSELIAGLKADGFLQRLI